MTLNKLVPNFKYIKTNSLSAQIINNIYVWDENMAFLSDFFRPSRNYSMKILFLLINKKFSPGISLPTMFLWSNGNSQWKSSLSTNNVYWAKDILVGLDYIYLPTTMKWVDASMAIVFFNPNIWLELGALTYTKMI